MKKRFDVVGMGISALDYVGTMRGFPAEDTKNRLNQLIVQGGGNIGNALTTLSRLGLRTSYIGKVGDDEIGRKILSSLKQEGVNISRALFEEGAMSPVTFVLVNERNKKRTVFGYRSLGDISPEDLPISQILSARFLLVDERFPSGSLIASEIARKHEIPVAINVERPSNQTPDLLPKTNYVICNEHFLRVYFGKVDPIDIFQKHNLKNTWAVTRGGRGCYCWDGGHLIRRRAFRVKRVDTTGAGDAFAGGFIYGLLQGWPMGRVLDFAQATAALNCMKLGARAGLPRREEVEAFLGSSHR